MPRVQHLAKRWVFTDNNPPATWDDDWTTLTLEDPDVQYSAWQHEVGESGTPHIQGLVIFEDRMTLPKVRAYLPTAHWEVMRGTLKQALDYVHKVESRAPGFEPQELGILEVCSHCGAPTD